MSNQDNLRTTTPRDPTPPAGFPPLRQLDNARALPNQTGEFVPPIVKPEAQRMTAPARRTDTIRLRMILSFVIAVLLPLTGLSLVSVVSGTQGEREASITRMETVIGYKETLLKYWSDSLKSDLSKVLQGENMISDLRTIIQASSENTTTPEHETLVEEIRSQFRAWVVQSLNFSELYVFNPEGVIVLSTDPTSEGSNHEDQNYFRNGLLAPYLAPPTYVPSTRQTVFNASLPISNNQGELIGVLAGKARLKPLNLILDTKTGLGETGQTYMISMNGMLLVGLNNEDHGKLLPVDEIRQAMESLQVNYATFRNLEGDEVYGISAVLPELQTIVVIEQASVESVRLSIAALAVNVSVGLASVLVAVFISLLITRTIATPISDLADTAQQIASGDVDVGKFVELPTTTGPAEISILFNALDRMTSQLNGLITGLEERVSQRTHDIEQRTNYLEASAQVSQATASILDPEELMKEAVSLIRERFDLYYIGLFLVDEAREWAVLRAGTGQAGQNMLDRGHRLRISATPLEGIQQTGIQNSYRKFAGLSMIGWCIANAQARIAQAALEDEVRFATPELPDTRSEAAIPLRSRGQVIGALSIQSDKSNAFDQTFIAVLQSMADQLANAIENARLFAESQHALEAERRAYGLQTQAAWNRLLESQEGLSLSGDAMSGAVTVSSSGQIWYPEMIEAIKKEQTIVSTHPTNDAAEKPNRNALAVPIRIRGQIVGVMDLSRSISHTDSGGWTAHEIAILESVSEQLGIALESARLYSETQRRAEQERLVADAASQMRQSLNVESVIKTAAEQIYKSLGLDSLVIQLTPEDQEKFRNMNDENNGPQVVTSLVTPDEEFSGEPS